MHTIPVDIHDALFAAGDRLGPFRDRMRWYDDIGSTNDVAASLAQAGAAEGTVVAANTQTSGRGRLGRAWASPPGAGLYVSLILRPPQSAAPLLTIAAGVAIAEGLHRASGLDVDLKWPNDVCVGARKLAGILAEATLDYVVVGFGINLLTAAYPPDVASRATSIEQELGRRPDRGLVLAECLAALGDWYAALCARRASDIISAWRARARRHMGKPVEWEAGGSTRRGVARDIDDDGALLVRTGDEIVRVISGEVRWL